MSRELVAQFAALPIRQARTNVSDISEAPRIFVGAEDQRSDSSCRTARAGEEAAHYGLTISSQRRFDPIPRSLARLVDRGNILGDYTFQMMFAGYLEHGRPVDVEPVRWDFDARVLEAEVGERFAAFEVGQVGCRGAVDVQDVEDVVGGQGVVAELCGGFEHVHPALQPGEGRDTVGSEGDDLAVKNRFAVVEHRALSASTISGNEALKLLPLRDQSAQAVWCRWWRWLFDAVPFRLEGPALPLLVDAQVWRASAGTGFPVAGAHASLLCAGLYWFRPVFGQFSEVETIAI